jgi:hypothetical protein
MGSSRTSNQCDGCRVGIPSAAVEEIANRLIRLVREGQITSQDAALDFIYDEGSLRGVSIAKIENYLEHRDDLDFNIWGEYCDRHRTLHDCRGED